MSGKHFRVFDDLFWKYMLAYKKRTGFTIMGVILSVILFFGSGTVYTSIQHANCEQAKAWNGNFDASGQVSPEDYRKLKELDYVEEVLLGQQEGPLRVVDANGKNTELVIKIRNLEQWDQSIFAYDLLEGWYPQNPDEIMLDRYLAAYFDVEVGDSFDIICYNWFAEDDEAEKKSFQVSGIYDTPWLAFAGDNYGHWNLPIFGQIDKSENYRTLDVYIRFRNHRNYMERLSEDGIFLERNGSVTEYLPGYQKWNTETLEYIVFLLAFTLLFWIAVLIIRNAFVMSVAERARDYGILRCMGCSQYRLRRLLMKEGVTIAIIGCILGMGISMLLIEGGRYLNGIRQILIDMGIYPFFHARTAWWTIGLTVLLTLGAVLFSLLEPARQIGLIAPSDAVNGHVSIKKERFRQSHTIWIRKIFGIEGEYAYKNLLRNRGKFFTSTAGIAFSIAGIVVSVTIFQVMEKILQVNTDVRSGYNAIANFDDITGKSQADVEQMVEDLLTVGSIEDAVPVYGVFEPAYKVQQNTKLADGFPSGLSKDDYAPFRAMGIDREEIAGLEELLLEGSLDYEALQQGGAIICRSYYDYDAPNIVNGQMFIPKLANERMRDLQVGDLLFVPNEHFLRAGMTDQQFLEKVKEKGYRYIPVAAIIDYNPAFYAGPSEVLFAEEYFREEIVTADVEAGGFEAVWMKYSKDYDVLEMQNFQMEHLNYWINNTEEVGMLAVLRGYRQLILLLALITAGIGAMNIFQTLSSNIALRYHELQVMRTIGMSRKQILKMLGLEGGMAAILGGLLGTGFGIGIGYCLTQFAMELKDGDVYRQISYRIPWLGIGAAVLLAGFITGVSIWIARNEFGEEREKQY